MSADAEGDHGASDHGRVSTADIEHITLDAGLDDEGIPAVLREAKPTEAVLREQVWRPVNRHNQWRAFVFVGREGLGKSLTCASIMEMCDPTFSADRIHFETAEFMSQVAGMPADDRQGKAVMLDESGVDMGVRSWYDQDQIQLNKVLQTARDDNMIVGMTLPTMEELDSQVDNRLHAVAEMRSVNIGEYGRFSWKNRRIYGRDDREAMRSATPYPRYTANGRTHRITTMAVGPPSEELVEAYEERKAAFKKQYYEDTVASLSDEEDAEAEEEPTPKEIAEDIKADGVDQYVSEHGGNGNLYINWRLIRGEFDLSRADAQTVRDLLSADDEVTIDD